MLATEELLNGTTMEYSAFHGDLLRLTEEITCGWYALAVHSSLSDGEDTEREKDPDGCIHRPVVTFFTLPIYTTCPVR